MTTSSDCLTLSHRQTWTRLGISRSTFYALLRTGVLDEARAPVGYRFSRAKLDAFIDGPIWRRGLRVAS